MGGTGAGGGGVLSAIAWIVGGALAVCAACSTPIESNNPETAAEIESDLKTYLEIIDPHEQVRAVLVHHEGDPVLERYSEGVSPDQYWDVQSVGKSLMSALIGIALDEGHLQDVNQTLAELLPDYAAEMAPGVGDITLHELLTHTGGLVADQGTQTVGTVWESTDWVRHILADTGPGEGETHRFAYSSAAAHLMSPILVEATGRSVLEYAREVLFVPLEIPSQPVVEPVMRSRDGVVDAQALEQYYAADFAWPVDPQGFHDGAGGQRLRPRDLALFGQLFLDEGRWGDQQVVPTAWVERSTSPLVPIRDVTEAYGYMWWVTEIAGDPAYLALGFGGQMIAVVPNRELVVVVATEFDQNDPLLPTKVIRAPVLIELVNTWVAPHFPSADGS